MILEHLRAICNCPEPLREFLKRLRHQQPPVVNFSENATGRQHMLLRSVAATITCGTVDNRLYYLHLEDELTNAEGVAAM